MRKNVRDRGGRHPTNGARQVSVWVDEGVCMGKDVCMYVCVCPVDR